MPSARELLEQADALMRRNRSPLMDDIPVLTDSVREVPLARTARGPLPHESNAPDTFPMLTEPVAASSPALPAASPAAPMKQQAVVDEGDPSDWLQLGGAEPSVIGDAPDSIAIVPPVSQQVSEEIELVAPPEVEEAFDAELADRAHGDSGFVEPTPAPITPFPPVAEAPASPISADAFEWEPDTVTDAPDEHELPPVEIAQPVELATAPPVPPAPVEEPVEAQPSAQEREAAEQARWASMAEEIRMQVLQRIDLFTDTGLRDQLGERLQPIVDRASADLVATINQHVGDLLRSYVAEAIEREIESWKRNTEKF